MPSPKRVQVASSQKLEHVGRPDVAEKPHGQEPGDLDRFDLRILEVLEADGRVAWSELAEKVGLSVTPVVRRVRAMEAAGYITGYAAQLNREKLYSAVTVFVFVTVDVQNHKAHALFEEHVRNARDVLSCHLISGEADYLLRVSVTGVSGYHRFAKRFFTGIRCIARITSNFAVYEVPLNARLPTSAVER